MALTKMNSSNEDSKNVDLLIIGAGPVGLTAAVEAKRLGLSVRIIDRKKKRSSHDSRALVIHARVVELLEPIQNGAVIEEIKKTAFGLSSISIYLQKRSCGCFPKKNDGEDDSFDRYNVNIKETEWGDTDYPNSYFLPQYETERILEEAFNKDGGQVEYGVSLESLTQDGNLVFSTVRNEADNSTETVTSKWVLGSDGGRSKTRDLVGIKLNRLESNMYFVVADIVFKGDPPLSQPSGRGGHIFPSDNGMMAFLPHSGENSYRVVGEAPAGIKRADQLDMNETFFEQMLYERTGRNFVVELGPWQSIFHITHGSTDSYRNGNVMLAGDASHVHSPVGAQGMNLGMQDANNLLWKLAWAKRILEAASTVNEQVAAKAAVETILDSYHSERHALGQDLIRSVEFGTKILGSKNQLVKFLRDTYVRIALRSDQTKNNFRKTAQLDMAYSPHSSPIIVGSKSKMTCVGTPGQRLPNIRLEDGSHLHSHIDRVRHTWVFLNWTGSPSTSSPETSGVRVVSLVPANIGDQVSIPSISKKTLAAHQVLLVRPDQFITGVGTTQEEILSQLKRTGIDGKALDLM
eukprot:jgi/Psemu1/290137/fgenesh1_pg.451_\